MCVQKLDVDPIERKKICLQICKAITYIHSKNHLHRDISPKNILVKFYDDVLVCKLSDFGLVKIPDSNLTNVATEMKGSYNDPSLELDGFANYNLSHEVYALTKVLLFILTGKKNLQNLRNPILEELKTRGLNTEKEKRFKSVNEIIKLLQKI